MQELDTSGETERARARSDPTPHLFFVVVGSFLFGATRAVPLLYHDLGWAMGTIALIATLALGGALDGWRRLKQTVTMHDRTIAVVSVWSIGWCAVGVLLAIAGRSVWLMANSEPIRWS